MDKAVSAPAPKAARPTSRPLAAAHHKLRGVRFRSRRSGASQLHAIEGLSECLSCGYFQKTPDLARGQVANCRRCHGQIGWRRTNPPVSTPFAFCVASAVLYLVAIFLPLMTMDLYGRSRPVTLLTGPYELWRDGWGVVAVLVLITTVIVPPIVIGLMLAVLVGASRRRLPTWAPKLLQRYERLRPWSMVEVYMLGVFVAYTKLVDLARVEVGPAVYALAALMLTMAATDSTVDVDLIWQKRPVSRFVRRADGKRMVISTVDASAIELPPARQLVTCTSCGLVCTAHRDLPQEALLGYCPRCDGPMRRRKPQAVLRCILLVACAVILYVPANLYPVMTIIKLSRGGGHTIMNGVIELYQAGSLPLALIVLFASITVPVLKILGLSLMCWSTWRGSTKRLVDRARLFRVIDFIGRWSMIDVFMVSILVAMVHFGSLANVNADPGVFSFASVVILTIFAANCFDPRVMWDAAGLNGVGLARTWHGGVERPARHRKAESVSA